jgi:hypothetical protein
MTAYCQSTSNRSRPTAFMLPLLFAGTERLPEQPVPPNHSLDTPDDEQFDEPNPGDPGPPVLKPPKRPHLPGMPERE